ncbi:MAG: hypothetical protein HY815_09515 [Candidatus Riflebacteria bacterium]|nr:hypothetical protein [Candidatus Riflebacteria bacterium]
MGVPESELALQAARSRRNRLVIFAAVGLGLAAVIAGPDELARLIGRAEPDPAIGTPPDAQGLPGPPWQDEALHEPLAWMGPIVPLLAYREALIAGLTHLHGHRVQPLDPSDRRLAKEWDVYPQASPGVGEKPLRVEVTFSRELPGPGQVGGTYRVMARGSGGSKTLRVLPARPGAMRLDEGSELALDDLPVLLESLGLQPAGKRPPGGGDPKEPFRPGGIATLAAALRPLDGPGPASPAALARAAHALAWRALVDHRVAPALAGPRAAQALALAAVADRAAGVRSPKQQPPHLPGPGPKVEHVAYAELPESAAARWLAPAAAAGDFWLLAARPPPAGFTDLAVLHQALMSQDLPREKPADWALPRLLALVERSVQLTNLTLAPRFLEWSIDPEMMPVAWPYLATLGEFSTLAMTASMTASMPLSELAEVAPWLGSDVPAEALAAIKARPSGPGFDPARLLAGGNQGSPVVPLARALSESAVRCRSFARRVVLEEVADSLLHSLWARNRARRQYARQGQPDPLAKEVVSQQEWRHPDLQWFLCDPTMSSNVTGLRSLAIFESATVAISRMPGLLNLNSTASLSHTVDGRYVWTIGQYLLSRFPDNPGQVAQAARIAGETGRTACSQALVERLLKTQQADTIARVSLPASLNTQFGRHELLLGTDARHQANPHIAMVLAEQRGYRADRSGARAILERAFASSPSSIGVARELVKLLCFMGEFGQASEVLDRFIATDPPGLERYVMTLELVNRLVSAGKNREEALQRGRSAASSWAAWAMLDHGLNAAGLGEVAEGRKMIGDAQSRYGKGARSDFHRAAIDVIESRGQRGWESLQKAEPQAGLDDLDRVTRAISTSGVTFPDTPIGRKLALVKEIGVLATRARTGPVAAEAFASIVDRVQSAGPDRDRLRQIVHNYQYHLRITARILHDLVTTSAKGKSAGAAFERILRLDDGITLGTAAALLTWLDLFGATQAELMRALELLAGHLPPCDQPVAREISRSSNLVRAWLAVAPGDQDPVKSVVQLLMSLWLHGRDQDVRTLAGALVGSCELPRPLLPALVFVSGSVANAHAWLKSKGVPSHALANWGRPELCTQDELDHRLLAFVRPDACPVNVLNR